MPYETDERLKSYLDTNQLGREQLCRDVLSVDPRFGEVTPRHPRGGPDGGRDLEARYRQRHLTFGAVGFINQATDSSENRRAARAKFQSDLRRALSAEPKPECFVFFTNINLSVTEKDELVKSALAKGLTYCEVMDRERLRIALDGPDGFSARYQHLGLPLSEAEQASFFAKWGDDIQGVVSSGFARVDSTLRRLLFLQEASSVLSEFVIFFELDRTYAAEEIGHFRAFCYMHLKEPKHGIFGILFGSSDRANRMREDWPGKPKEDEPGIAGIGGVADVAQDREQPRLDRPAAKRVEMAERAKITFLHRVVGIAAAAQQITRQRVDIVEVRKGERFETLRLAALAQVNYATRHHRIPGHP